VAGCSINGMQMSGFINTHSESGKAYGFLLSVRRLPEVQSPHCFLNELCYFKKKKTLFSFHAFMVRFPAGAGNFSFHHRVRHGSGAHPASYPVGTRDSSAGGKAAGA
jgi:hypothetical protein